MTSISNSPLAPAALAIWQNDRIDFTNSCGEYRLCFLVTGTHVSPVYTPTAWPVVVTRDTGIEPAGFYADCHRLGCGKTFNSPETAIRHLFSDHAIQITRIEIAPRQERPEPWGDALADWIDAGGGRVVRAPESWLDRLQTAIDTGAAPGTGDGGAYAGEHSDPESALNAVAAAPVAPIPFTSALSYRALLVLWHRRNLETAEIRAAAIEESIKLYSDWRDPLGSVRDYVNYYESHIPQHDDSGRYCGSIDILT